jgi:two-component system, sensor histidine kinase
MLERKLGDKQATVMPMSRKVWVAGFAMVAVLIVAAVSAIFVIRNKEVADWERQMTSLTMVLSEQLTESLVPVSEALSELVKYAQIRGVTDTHNFRTKLSTPHAHQALKDAIGNLTLADVATFVASNGDNINFTRSYPVTGINLVDRDYFKHHLEVADDNEFISSPVRNKGNGKWTFYISRRISDSSGQFLGVVIVGISVERIAQFHEKVVNHLGKNASISLFRDDLKLLSRWPFISEMQGKTNQTGSAYQILKNQGRTEGTILTRSARFSSGKPEERMGTLRPVRRYPLYVLTVITGDMYLSAWYRALYVLTGVTAVSSLLILLGTFVLSRNIRKREADLAERQRLQLEAEAANQAKSNFLATMSHEIRTPLNGILGMAQLMQIQELGEHERRDYARTILNSGRTLLALLNDILDNARIESGAMELRPEVVRISELMRDCIKLFEAEARAKGLELKYEWHGRSSQSFMLDPVRLRQMISNLLSNAIKFSERGSVQLKASLETVMERQVLRVEVIDTGIGISEKDQALLFRPFSQLDSSSTRRYGGSGLGLATVRNLARLMGGDTGVESVEGQGASFWFTVKIDQTSIECHQTAQSHPAHDKETGVVSKYNILIVEDDRTNQLVLSAMLSKSGYGFQKVDNGLEAVIVATSRQRPDLVLMDVQMPEMDGIAATKAIREWEKSSDKPGLPIVALTAGAFQGDRERCLEAGMNEFLTKPVMIQALLDALEKFLSKTPPPTEASQG